MAEQRTLIYFKEGKFFYENIPIENIQEEVNYISEAGITKHTLHKISNSNLENEIRSSKKSIKLVSLG